MLTFSFELIQDPGMLEGVLSHQSSLLKFFNGSFVVSITFIGHMPSSGGLVQIYVSNYDDIDMTLFLSCFGFDLVVVFTPVF
jgi:hypothetical protein